MNVREMTTAYLREAPVMHLATAVDNRPWSVPVYFVVDPELNLYWLSWPERRHSQMLLAKCRVAASVVVKVDAPVIGIEVEGVAEEVIDHELIRTMMAGYVAKYDAGHSFVDLAEQGRNHHRMYRLVTERMVLFDEVHFKESKVVLDALA